MMWKNLKILLPALLGVLFFCGCWFSRSAEVKYYDLKALKSFTVKPGIMVGVFVNRSGSGNRILVKDSSYMVRQDPVNKWLLTPGELVTKCLQLSFVNGGGAAGKLMGQITVFEADLAKNEFIFGGNYRFDGGTAVDFKFTAPLAGKSAESVAAAASECVSQLAEKIASEAGK